MAVECTQVQLYAYKDGEEENPFFYPDEGSGAINRLSFMTLWMFLVFHLKREKKSFWKVCCLDVQQCFRFISTNVNFVQVETIGDAYCVAGGLHRESETHAVQIALMALKMMELSDDVMTPTGDPIQVGVQSEVDYLS